MYIINKIVGYLISPAGVSMTLVAAAIVAHVLGRRRLAGWAVLLVLVNCWGWSTPMMAKWMGVALEAEFLENGQVPTMDSLPNADLIELHGGSMGVATNLGYSAEMWSSADRVWQAARLWKAGKAPKILVTSKDTDLSTEPLLTDLGVPKEAIVYDFGPRNTEEEAKAIARMFECSECSNAEKKPKVLVVTSAWHMKRTMLMYQKYAPNVEAIPAPCDFENTMGLDHLLGWMSLLPDPAAFAANSIAFHEWLGYFGYKWFR